jgi:hypothetical protein
VRRVLHLSCALRLYGAEVAPLRVFRARGRRGACGTYRRPRLEAGGGIPSRELHKCSPIAASRIPDHCVAQAAPCVNFERHPDGGRNCRETFFVSGSQWLPLTLRTEFCDSEARARRGALEERGPVAPERKRAPPTPRPAVARPPPP